MSKKDAASVKIDAGPRFRSADEEFDENGMPIYHDTLLGTMKSLWKHIGKYKRDTIYAWLLVALETLGEILIPYVMQYLVDEIDVGASGTINVGMCFLWGGIMLLLACCGVVTGILAGFFAASASAAFLSTSLLSASCLRLASSRSFFSRSSSFAFCCAMASAFSFCFSSHS